jgi:hypothetical protein
MTEMAVSLGGGRRRRSGQQSRNKHGRDGEAGVGIPNGAVGSRRREHPRGNDKRRWSGRFNAGSRRWETWLGMFTTCRQHFAPIAKCRHFWPTSPCRGNTKLIMTQYFLSGIADIHPYGPCHRPWYRRERYPDYGASS